MAELSKLGRYQLKGVLGRGAMGVVYEGLDPSLNRRVAVKTILKNAAIDAETAQMYSAQFAREAQAAGRLNHPNIVGVHDFAEEGDVAYLVMEYIQGRELRSFFEAKEKFEIAEAVRIMGELLDALGFAHDAGVIHRDIKPANVMLDANRRVKLADFGVARIQDSERSAAGTMVGTPAFMSPEQISGGKIDKRTDLFSAGTILYQLLTGDQPFTGAGAWTVAKKIMQDDPPQPSSVVKSVSPVFDAIVNKALAKKQADRYSSAKEFADALRGALRDALGPQPSATATTPPIPVPAQKPGPAAQASEAEVEFWKAIQNSTDAAEFEFYLEQFPGGIYAGLARHKIARLSQAPVPAAETTVRLQAEAAAKAREAELQAAAKARRDAAEKARQEAEAAAKREAAEKEKRESEEKARREAETRARVETELKARREAEEKARRDAVEKAKREADERARQAAALARLKQQGEAARSAEADPEATVAITRRPASAASAPAPVEQKKSFLVPAIIGTVVVLAGVAAFFAMNRTPAPAPAAVTPMPVPAKPAAVAAPAPAAPAAPTVDEAKIRREVEERIRGEYADKSAAEQAAAAKMATARAMQEKQAAAKAAANKAMAEKQAAAKSAGEKAAQEKAAAEKAQADQQAAEKAAADKAAADKAAVEKQAEAKMAGDKAAAEKAAADKAAVAKAAASVDTRLERFIRSKGSGKVVSKDPPRVFAAMADGEVLYVNDGRCPRGMIKELTSDMRRNRSWRCIPLPD